MKKFFMALLGIVYICHAQAQGCVAIRSITGFAPDLLFENIRPNDKFIFGVTNRYFSASSTYVGEKFITDTLVTNRIYTLNLSALRLFDKGWSLAVALPISANSRNNSRDHGGPQTPRYTTRSFGFGDLRIAVYKWLSDPVAHKRWNVQVGLGLKFPTGDYDYKDYFVRNDSTTVLAPVDQAIQPGDGGAGLTVELNSYYSLTQAINLFVSGFVLINLRDQNGVSNLKGRNPTPTEIKNNTTVMSVPDQYSFRAGGNVQYRQFALTAALRYERVPVKDLLGGNKGFRRASTIVSAEPGISYRMQKMLAFVYTGIPFHREIIQNAENNMTPAGFADLVTTFGIQFKL